MTDTITAATAELVRDLTNSAAVVHEADNTVHLVLPNGYSHIDITDAIEKANSIPNRKRGTTQLKDVDSLLAYCSDQAAMETSYIYADPDARKIVVVFNDSRSIHPGWRDHRAEFTAEYTQEFSKWLANNGTNKFMSQTDFAEFVEDNFADVTEPAAQQLLEIATTIQATTGINFSSAKRLQNGQTQLAYSETIEARAGATGALEIPKEFVLGLRIFKNGSGYKLRARLKYRLHAGGIKFWYELDRYERAVEDAFADYVKTVREKSGYTVLIGKP